MQHIFCIPNCEPITELLDQLTVTGMIALRLARRLDTGERTLKEEDPGPDVDATLDSGQRRNRFVDLAGAVECTDRRRTLSAVDARSV